MTTITSTIVTTRELRKGDRVLLRNGWQAVIEDNNTRGLIRLCTVEGHVTEMGSVYSHDIMKLLRRSGNIDVLHTASQLRLRRSIMQAHQ